MTPCEAAHLCVRLRYLLGVCGQKEHFITFSINAIDGNAQKIAVNAENTTDKIPTTPPMTTSTLGARLSLTQ